MADLTHRIAADPLEPHGDSWAGGCLARSCKGRRLVEAWGSEDGRTAQVATVCGSCGRVEMEPAPGMEHPALPGMEAHDG